MKKINIITLNTAIDILIRIKEFLFGNIIRSTTSNKYPSGKGLNTARILNSLETDCNIWGFIGENDRKFFNSIKTNYINPNFISIHGDTRNNITIIDQKGNLISHIQNSSSFVSSKDLSILLTEYFLSITPDSIHIISGSLPYGLGEDTYNQIIDKIKEKQGIVILDTSEKNLINSISHKPFLVKPNIEEFEFLTNTKFTTISEIGYEMKKYNDSGINIFIVSLGKDGALISTPNSNYFYKAELSANNIHTNYDEIGCGDSMIGGIAHALSNDCDIETVIIEGIAAGTANLYKEGPGNIDIDRFYKFKDKVKITKEKI